MARYFLNRIVVGILVAVTVSIFSFSLLRLSGDLAAVLAGDGASNEQIAAIAHAQGLDRSFTIQYLDWVGRAVRGDFGVSVFSGKPVAEIIASAVTITVQLAIYALILSLIIGIPLGVLAAAYHNSWIDRFATVFALFGQAIPNFWLALMLIVVFGLWLAWLPISGTGTPLHFVLPTIAVALQATPVTMRMTRSGMIEVLQSDYIRTARAKGLPPYTIFFKHALRNAILPVIALAMVNFGRLLGGTVVIESIFALNGIGFEALRAISRHDFPVVQSIVAFVSLAYIGLTVLSDLISAQIDPRVRLS